MPQHCAFCGEVIDPTGKDDPREPEPCASKECQSEVRAMWREMAESAQYEAEQDNYSLYD